MDNLIYVISALAQQYFGLVLNGEDAVLNLTQDQYNSIKPYLDNDILKTPHGILHCSVTLEDYGTPMITPIKNQS